MHEVMPISRRGLIVSGIAAASVSVLPAGLSQAVAQPVAETVVTETKAVTLARMFEEIVSLRKSGVERAVALMDTPPRTIGRNVKVSPEDQATVTAKTDELIVFMNERYPAPSADPELKRRQYREAARLFSTSEDDRDFRMSFLDEREGMDEAVVPVAVVRALLLETGANPTLSSVEGATTPFDTYSDRYERMILNCTDRDFEKACP